MALWSIHVLHCLNLSCSSRKVVVIVYVNLIYYFAIDMSAFSAGESLLRVSLKCSFHLELCSDSVMRVLVDAFSLFVFHRF